jgi:hypothetical protein
MSVTTLNPIEVRKAGMRALNQALGYDVAQEFLKQFTGTGDIVQTLRELPEPSPEELMTNIYRMQEAYEQGEVDIAGRPIAKG